MIWYLPHPINNKKEAEETKGDDGDLDIEDDEDDSGDDKTRTLKRTLLWELLTRVRKESKKQSDILLKSKIDAIKDETPQQWIDLTTYNVVTPHSKDGRQDVVGGIVPKYTANVQLENKDVI